MAPELLHEGIAATGWTMPSIPLELIDLHDAYRSGTLKPSDVVEARLARVATCRDDAWAPVWISTVDANTLRQRAAALDRVLADDPDAALSSPVFGALFAVKDNIDLAGLPTTAGCPAIAYLPTHSAHVVETLEAAGAIAIGKTNLDQFATGLVGTRSPYGAVPNSFRPEYISGGSSSGSAVAVAKGQVHFALGTDTAGSGRVPAGLNNVVGWKPTRGVLSNEGIVPACRSLDCVAVFAMTVADASRAVSVMRGDGDVTALDRALVHAMQPADIRGRFRFGIPKQREFFGDAHATVAFDDAITRMRSLGGTPVEVDMAPLWRVADMLYEGPWVAERHAAIREFFDTQPDAIDPTVRAIIAGASRFNATDTFVALAALDVAQRATAALWSDIDLLLVPTAPTIYTIADVMADPITLNRRMGTYTNFVNLLDWAAIAVPSSLRADGLPFGVTLVGPGGSDIALASLGQRYHDASFLMLGATGIAPVAAESLTTKANGVRLAVVGAHLSGLPLNHELTSRGARLVRSARTAPTYRLFRLPNTQPPKPGLVKVRERTVAGIEIEVWELGLAAFADFVSRIPSPLGIGTLDLEDGTHVQGFVCEASATVGAEDVTAFGGWRNYIGQRALSTAA